MQTLLYSVDQRNPFDTETVTMTTYISVAVALIAFLIGIVVMRPAMMRSVKLAESIATAPQAERAAIQAEVQRLRARGAVLGKVVAWMLLFTLAAMAVARYL